MEIKPKDVFIFILIFYGIYLITMKMHSVRRNEQGVPSLVTCGGTDGIVHFEEGQW